MNWPINEMHLNSKIQNGIFDPGLKLKLIFNKVYQPEK